MDISEKNHLDFLRRHYPHPVRVKAINLPLGLSYKLPRLYSAGKAAVFSAVKHINVLKCIILQAPVMVNMTCGALLLIYNSTSFSCLQAFFCEYFRLVPAASPRYLAK